MDVTVIGMGHMGRAVATRLAEADGLSVRVWNRTPGRAGSALEAGAREVGSLAEAVDGADVVLVSLADDDAVLSVVSGTEGAAARLADRAVLIDLSTVSPATSRRQAELCDRRFLAAPILGAPAAVSGGVAMYLLGGPQELASELDSVWAALSPLRRWCGEDPGSATILKLLCNYLLMSGLAVLAEVVAVGQAAGMENEGLAELLRALPLVAPALHNRVDDMVAGDHDGWFAIRLGAKDIRLARELGAELGVPLPLAAAVGDRYEEGVRAGVGDLDVAGIIELLRAR